MRQFKRVIYLYEKFKIPLTKMICLNEEIKGKLKLRNFKKVFQITKIIVWNSFKQEGNWSGIAHCLGQNKSKCPKRWVGSGRRSRWLSSG